MGDAVPNSQNRTPQQRERMARNFVAKHGPEGLVWLIDAFAMGKSGQEIAERFHVSRERVKQWRAAFGLIVTEYRVHEDVRKVADERDFDVIDGEGRGEEGSEGPGA